MSTEIVGTLSEPVLLTRPLRRQRFLTVAGAALFGFATKMVLAEQAQALHEPPYAGCFGCNMCDCCVWGPGCTCCSGDGPCYNCGCPTNPSSACWYSCVSGSYWKCCDFKQWNGSYYQCCICRQYIGAC